MFKAAGVLFGNNNDLNIKKREQEFIEWSKQGGEKRRQTSEAGLLVGAANTIFTNFARACDKINLYTQHLQNAGLQGSNLQEQLLSYIWDKHDLDEKGNKATLNLSNQQNKILQKDVILSDAEKSAFLAMTMVVKNPELSADEIKQQYGNIAKDQKDSGGYLKNKTREPNSDLDQEIKSSLAKLADENTFGADRISGWVKDIKNRQQEINQFLAQNKPQSKRQNAPGTDITSRPSSEKTKQAIEARPLSALHALTVGQIIH